MLFSGLAAQSVTSQLLDEPYDSLSQVPLSKEAGEAEDNRSLGAEAQTSLNQRFRRLSVVP